MMVAQILDGRALAKGRGVALQGRIDAITQRRGHPPGLGVILVGADGPSSLYVRNKAKAAHALGIASQICRLPATCSAVQLAGAIAAYNASPHVDAFLLQLPLPDHLDAAAMLAQILPHKDADGLHPVNVAALQRGAPGPRPCTPLGCMALLQHTGISLQGLHAVVLGRSTIVGQPMAKLLLDANATVTHCHAKTRDLASHVGRADVLVAAVGRPELVQGSWVKPGAVVLDVGINRILLADGSVRLCGDVAYQAAQQRAAFITPVPGGVGPMTIAMLLQNAVAAAEQSLA